MNKSYRVLAAAGAVLLSGPALAQTISSSVYADDEFKIFISNDGATAGVEFAQGTGYNLNFIDTLALYPGRTHYMLQIWVREIGGSPTGLMGEFTLSGPRGCRFANSTTKLLTNTDWWRVTRWLPVSTPMVGGPLSPAAPYFNNVIPKFVMPTLTPVNLGANGGANPWPGAHPYPGVDPGAQWIVAPGPSRYRREMWFSTWIACKTPD